MSDRETPAKTIELTDDIIDRALSAGYTDRHHAIGPHAKLYQVVKGCLAILGEHEADLKEFVDEDFIDDLSTIQQALVVHVREEHEHAVRWTVDPYDELNYEESDNE